MIKNVLKLRENLTRWAELEPERCWRTDKGVEIVDSGWIIHELEDDTFLSCGDGKTLVSILICVMAAIEERKWGWTKRPFSNNNASVIRPLHPGFESNNVKGATLAENLLDAYVQALEKLEVSHG